MDSKHAWTIIQVVFFVLWVLCPILLRRPFRRFLRLDASDPPES